MSESTTWPNLAGRQSETVPYLVARRLLESVVAIGNHHSQLADRRRAFLHVLMNELEADSAMWTWGHGKPTDLSLTAVGHLDVGITEAQLAVYGQWGLDPAASNGFYHRIYREMQGSPDSRSMLVEDYIGDERNALPVLRQYQERAGWGSWLQNTRYWPANSWSNINLLRNTGRPEFQRREAAILELVADSVSWLHATTEDSLPPETFLGLTQRQRTVMFMLLNGMSRKTIARLLGIKEDTVGDHLKSIYTHFGVASSIELAALFLRNQ